MNKKSTDAPVGRLDFGYVVPTLGCFIAKVHSELLSLLDTSVSG